MTYRVMWQDFSKSKQPIYLAYYANDLNEAYDQIETDSILLKGKRDYWNMWVEERPI